MEGEKKKKVKETKAADSVAREEKKKKDNAVQDLGIKYADLEAQLQKLEEEVEKLKAAGPVNAGDKAKEVGESPEPDRKDVWLDETQKEQGVSLAADG
ncbi:hypothetical protein MMC17_009778 [Xylographa soralifera]|nr:hypothetical protein [Xylographa soralifera]